MKVVIIKHENCGQKYIFEVPQERALKAGDLVLVQTKKGKTLGTCVCDSFPVESESVLSAISQAFGTDKPKSSVIGRYNLNEWISNPDN